MNSLSKRVFLREATGLVREMSLADATYIGVGIGENIPVGLPLIFVVFLYLFPQADLVLALAVGFLANLAIAALFGLMGAAMPRSGGDYVWTSRVLGPVVGFANNLGFLVAVIAAAIAWCMSQFPLYFLSTTFQLLGTLWKSPELVSTGVFLGTNLVTAFLISSLILLSMLVVSLFGRKVVSPVLGALTILTVIGTFGAIYAFASTSHEQFISLFDSYKSMLGSTYQGAIAVAQQNGWSRVEPTLIGALMPLVFSFNLYGGFNFQAFNAGEIKQAARNLPISIFIALFSGLVMWGGLAYATMNTVGRDFFQALSYLFMTNPTAYSQALSLPPTMTLFITMLTVNNPALFWLTFIGFTTAYLAFPLAYFQIIPRIIFAWSFDRIIPSWMSDVSERFHTPVKALVVTFVLMEIFTVVYVFSSWILAFVNWTLIFGILNIPWGIAALVFPYRKKHMFEQAPSFVRRKILGIPVVSIVGLIVALIGVFSVYFDLLTPAYSGPVAPMYLLLTIMPFVVAALMYLASKYYHGSRGIDLSLAFKEIPPE